MKICLTRFSKIDDGERVGDFSSKMISRNNRRNLSPMDEYQNRPNCLRIERMDRYMGDELTNIVFVKNRHPASSMFSFVELLVHTSITKER